MGPRYLEDVSSANRPEFWEGWEVPRDASKPLRVRRRERQSENPRERRMNLRFNDDEHEIVSLAAQRAGLTPASYAARVTVAVAKGELAPMPTGEADRIKAFNDADVSLNRVGNNLNQLTAVLNQAALIGTGEVLEVILQLRDEYTALRKEVGEVAERLLLAGLEAVPTRRSR
ncbi:plasmid mobilization protein [Streptomyces sp. NPDC001118]